MMTETETAKWLVYSVASSGVCLGLLGGLLGGCSFLVARGRFKRWVLGAYAGTALLGLTMLVAGVAAWWMGQPYAIWYVLTLNGFGGAVIFGGLYPVIRRQYALAERRKIKADAVRAG